MGSLACGNGGNIGTVADMSATTRCSPLPRNRTILSFRSLHSVRKGRQEKTSGMMASSPKVEFQENNQQ